MGCVVPLHSALAYDNDLPAVESRNTYGDDEVAPNADRPLQLREEDNTIQQSVATIPDTPSARLDQLQQQVQELQGKLDLQEHRFQELTKQTLDNYQDLDQRLKSLVATQQTQAANSQTKNETTAQEPGKDNPATAVSVGTDPQTNSTAEDEKNLYHKAYSLAQAKQYDASIEAFNQLIKTYPNSTYTPTAYFWMGELYIIKSKYDQATESFNQIVTNHSSSPKVSEALFKVGYIAYARGNNKLAIKNFTDVKNKYPGTSAAKQADQYLKKLKTKK